MKNYYNFKKIQQVILVVLLLFLGVFADSESAYADIWEPEGLNMPGGWNGWANPPSTLALASYTQVIGGRVTKISIGTPRWQTIISVAASGGDIVGGSYPFVFSSGSTGNPWGNTWKGVNVTMNSLQSYNYNSGADNQITVVNGKWYTMNWKDNGYANSQAIFMETSAAPVDITDVSVPSSGTVNVPTIVNVTVSNSTCPEEIIYLRYSTDGWLTSTLVPFTMIGTGGSATIPGQADGTTVSYYVFSSTVAVITSNHDMQTIKLKNNGGANYSYLVGAAPISWANLQGPATGAINPGQTLEVSAQAYIAGITGQPTQAPGLQSWIGYSSSNTNPSTWTNWVSASYFGPLGSNDEFRGTIGATLAPGTYYYASRFQLGSGPMIYGGYNAGFWDGTTSVSGILTVNGAAPTVTTGAAFAITAATASVAGNVIADGGSLVTARGICWGQSADPTLADFYSVDGDGTGTFSGSLTSLLAGTTYHARAYATNTTGTAYGADVQFTTLYSVTFNVDMSTCNGFTPGSEFVYVAGSFPSAFWNEPGTNPALLLTQISGLTYSLNLALPAGTYDFKFFRNATWGGGEWIGGSNRSVTISGNDVVSNTWSGSINWANLQYPETGSIEVGGVYDVYAQVYIPNGITGATGGAYGMQAWIGYSTDPTNPSTWTNWVPALYSSAAGGNDEFKVDLAAAIGTPGTYYYASRFQFGNGSYSFGGFSATNGGFWDGTTNVSGILTILPGATKALNLTVFLEGIYDQGTDLMKQAMDAGPLPKYGAGIADQLTVELHESTSPYALAYTYSDVSLSTAGALAITNIPAIITGEYYIVIKHRNSVETWSANPVSFVNPVSVSFNFSDAATSAYGNNLKLIGTRYLIFGADGTQDGVVDGSDMAVIDNASTIVLEGYVAEDVNGDGIVDGSDMAMVDNNSTAVVQVQKPIVP